MSDNKSSGLFLGLDAGSISVKLALVDREGRLITSSYARHQGRPYQTALSSLTSLFENHDPALIGSVAVTGVSAGRLAELLGGKAVGEIRALTLAARRHLNGAKALIDIGGEDTKLVWFGQDEGGRLALADFAMNALCAAGTGSFLDQQAHRLNYDIGRFSALALKSEVPPRVAGRCSVFAKSDMIHLQQSATPDYEIIYGLCLAMARNLKSGLAKGRPLAAPVLFTGGVAANDGLARALREILELKEDELVIPPHHFVFGAVGAAEVALETFLEDWANLKGAGAKAPGNGQGLGAGSGNGSGNGQGSYPDNFAPRLDLSALRAFVKEDHRDPRRLAPLRRPSREPGTAEFDWGSVSCEAPIEVYIGVDVGSVSTNVALVTPEGKLVARQYLPTAGRPLEAICQGFAAIAPEVTGKAKVLGVCCTGSGRYLTADYLGADLTVNEITAQATAAVA
ncbi:MAG: ATPase, partial [Deltaproteobacteria bacterium]|nr:ATPase [Deltaproteobacteria bacterium]